MLTDDEIEDELDRLIEVLGEHAVRSQAWRMLYCPNKPVTDEEQRFWAAIHEKIRKPRTVLDRIVRALDADEVKDSSDCRPGIHRVGRLHH
jgi:hypothetical protein